MTLATFHTPARPLGAPFVEKTYELVDHGATNHLISWCSRGSSFIVYNTEDFAKQVLPKYFKHSNFSSFVRQLNTYGFRKISARKWQFANEHFLKGRQDLLRLIERRKPGCGAAPDLDRLTAHVHNTDVASYTPASPSAEAPQHDSNAVAAQAAAATSQLLQLALPHLQLAAAPGLASMLLRAIQPCAHLAGHVLGAHGSAFSPYVAPARVQPAVLAPAAELASSGLAPAAILQALKAASACQPFPALPQLNLQWAAQAGPSPHCKATAVLDTSFLPAPCHTVIEEAAAQPTAAQAAADCLVEEPEDMDEFDNAFPGFHQEDEECCSVEVEASSRESEGGLNDLPHSDICRQEKTMAISFQPSYPSSRSSGDSSADEGIVGQEPQRWSLKRRSMEDDSSLPLKKRRFHTATSEPTMSGDTGSTDDQMVWEAELSADQAARPDIICHAGSGVAMPALLQLQAASAVAV